MKGKCKCRKDFEETEDGLCIYPGMEKLNEIGSKATAVGQAGAMAFVPLIILGSSPLLLLQVLDII